MGFHKIHLVILVAFVFSSGILGIRNSNGQSRNDSGQSRAVSNQWPGTKTEVRKNFYFSETAITKEDKPFLTCMDGSGTEYILGSRSSGLFSFSTPKRKFRAVEGAELLQGKSITSIAIGTGKNELWAGTLFSGLYHRRMDGRWENFGPQDGLLDDGVSSIRVTPNVVWIGTKGGINGIVNGVLSKTSVTVQVFDIARDKRSGRCYAGHGASLLSVFDPGTSRWTTVDMGIKPVTSFNHVVVEPSGDILCGGFSGLFRVSGRTGQIEAISDHQSERLVSCLTVGEDGGVYLGLLGNKLGIHSLVNGDFVNIFNGTGVFRQPNAIARNNNKEWVIISFGRLWHFTDRFPTDGYLAPRDSISYDSEPLKAANQNQFTNPSYSANQSSPYSGQGFGVQNLPLPPEQNTSRGFGISGTDNSGFVNPSLTIANGRGSENIYRQVSLSGSPLCLCSTVSRVWAGTLEGSLFTITPKGESTLARSFDGAVTNLLYSASGRLYIVVKKRDIYIFTGFTYKLLGSSPQDIQVLADRSDNSGLWIGTSNGLYDLNGEKITYASVSETLPDKNIASIIVDGTATWVGTRLGLCQLVNGQWTVYSKADGLPSDDILSLAMEKGRLWAGTNDGLAVFSGRRFNVVNKLVAHQISVYGSDVIAGGPMGITGFTRGKWGQIIAIPGRNLNSVIHSGNVVVIATERGLYLADGSSF